ncbi:MAG: eukaryotic-like serine/threonine-protein kinase [Pseudothermotoga sp.]|jgi:serine/threonine-protein kinase|uniref:PASTA domain-containing protein n=1 Tax=Pseudothermotoga TaxID=1643951 RepID=UPI0007487E7D|nr:MULTISPECIES: PASTA domain-containing protein [Pseudothermotoga]KUK20890.1 MAG: PASTA domain containing protein [Pseudothermotoga lettingae]MDI3494348.1 eukaryotic-like serine/threonine-protein kinase [Pseudothermotoga sp.]HBJ82228.1 penicillin-binding protein [Pseudothermotoga sp.]HBT25824.1 penicillin-binding protein [Pseudothermotoga sp.]
MRATKNKKSPFKAIIIFIIYFVLGSIAGAAIFFSYFMIRPKLVEIPDLRSMQLNEAVEILKKTGLKPGQVIGTGPVSHTYPNAGQKVRKNREITIFLSEPQKIPIPDLVGIPEDTALTILSEMGFKVSITKMPYKGTDGRVIGIYPPVGTPVKQGDEINILIDSGEITGREGN